MKSLGANGRWWAHGRCFGHGIGARWTGEGIVGCAGAHGSAALGCLITSRGLLFCVTGEDLSAPVCLGQSPQGGRSSLPYLSAIDPIRAYAPPIFGNGEKPSISVDPIGSSARGAKATTGVDVGGRRLELNLLSHIQGVVHLNPKIPDSAFQFGMTEEKLDWTQVSGLAINLGSLRAAH